MRSPLAVTLLIAAFVVVHLVLQFFSEEQLQHVYDMFALTPERFMYFGWLGEGSAGEAALSFLSLISYTFLHSDVTHLLVNSLWFLIFATAVARRVGPARFLTLCLLTTLGAAITHLITHWGSPVAAIGASGMAAGMTGAAVRFIFIDPKATPVWPPRRLALLSRPVLLMSAVWTVINILLGVTGFAPEGFGRQVAWEAHIGGYFTGLLVFPLFDRQRSWIS